MFKTETEDTCNKCMSAAVEWIAEGKELNWKYSKAKA